jgi:hypothetical protein
MALAFDLMGVSINDVSLIAPGGPRDKCFAADVERSS